MKKVSLSILAIFTFVSLQSQKPHVAIAFIVDQFSWQEFMKVLPYCNHGLKRLYQNGVVFSNCIQPHGMPATATGHAALSTGTYAKDHGLTGNAWFDKQGTKIACDDAPKETAGVFDCNGNILDYGKSAHHLLVDGLSDQIQLASNKHNDNKVFSISLKSRSGIATASRLGKAIWFNDVNGCFTSSKAYFSSLPEWIKQQNKKNNITKDQIISWHLTYPKDSPAYGAVNKNTYLMSPPIVPETYINRPINAYDTERKNYGPLLNTPVGLQLTFNCAKRCIEANYTGKENIFFLWINISCTDSVNHMFGPDSYEVIDMCYKLDKDLGDFMDYLEQKVDQRDIVYALSSDHGTSQLLELIDQKGYPAYRVFYKKFIPELNNLLHEAFGTTDLIQSFQVPQFYLDMEQLHAQPTAKQKRIIATIKNFLLAQKGIKRVWTFDELYNGVYEPNTAEYFYKQQLSAGRSGYITVQTAPYCQLTKYETGASHRTPYNYNIHIPLLFYQKGSIEKQSVEKQVLSLQLPATLAKILHIPQPAACRQSALL